MKIPCPFYDISVTFLPILKEILAFKGIFGFLSAVKILETKTCHHICYIEKNEKKDLLPVLCKSCYMKYSVLNNVLHYTQKSTVTTWHYIVDIWNKIFAG